MKILLVDDDAFLRDMYATKFKEKGYDMDVAETAEVAIKKLEREAYDVILSDVVMPGLTGVDLLKRVREEKLGGTPACIILSNQSEAFEKEEAFREGAIGYIVKAERIPSEVVDDVITLIKDK